MCHRYILFNILTHLVLYCRFHGQQCAQLGHFPSSAAESRAPSPSPPPPTSDEGSEPMVRSYSPVVFAPSLQLSLIHIFWGQLWPDAQVSNTPETCRRLTVTVRIIPGESESLSEARAVTAAPPHGESLLLILLALTIWMWIYWNANQWISL